GGGTLSHAAIVGRGDGGPPVTAGGLGTMGIAGGGEGEGDGTTGRGTGLKQAPNGQGGSPVPPAIAWVDEGAPDEASSVCAAKRPGGVVAWPRGSTVRAEAFGRHGDQRGRDAVAAATLGGLGADAGPAEIEAAASAIRAELAGRDLGADLATLIGDAYEEL